MTGKLVDASSSAIFCIIRPQYVCLLHALLGEVSA